MNVTKLDFVAVPTTDPERTRQFYVGMLGLRPDARNEGEFWAGDTCISPWKPEWFGQEFSPSETCLLSLHVDDVAAARGELEGKGVEFLGDTIDTGVCHMGIFKDPDGNVLMLHNRYAPYE